MPAGAGSAVAAVVAFAAEGMFGFGDGRSHAAKARHALSAVARTLALSRIAACCARTAVKLIPNRSANIGILPVGTPRRDCH